MKYSNLLVTGGAGFIGSSFIRYLLKKSSFQGSIVNLDALTYAGSLDHLRGFLEHPRHKFIQGDILDQKLVEILLDDHEIDAVVHFAAETHVDRSIASAEPFVTTNVIGTLRLLEAIRKRPEIHFHHISTDEVYGSLELTGVFNEHSVYRPNSPYSASKAASDHLVRAYGKTYGLSTTLSHCSNNYGPCQHREKLIPRMITLALAGKPLPIYGKGTNIRDWLFVDDHAEAIALILDQGRKGETYDIGGGVEKSNLELVKLLLELLAEETGVPAYRYLDLISQVPDRPGHDFRYAIDSTKIDAELGWNPSTSLPIGLRKTIRWYLKQNSKKQLV
jgi:dTDP-glucose 4,6-dehydratase